MKMGNVKIIKCLAALLCSVAGMAFAGTPCGVNMEYDMVGTELRLTSPDPTMTATIGVRAFFENTDFSFVIIPDNVTEIGAEAFRGCTSLQTVYCRPQTPPSLGTDGFTDCHSSLLICVSALGDYRIAVNWSDYEEKFQLCYLDENDEPAIANAKVSSFRNTDKTEIDLFRTLRKAGCFNTLCLPFSVPDINSSPLAGSEVYEFVSATVEEGKLQLEIVPLAGSALVAGTPYLIQWSTTGEELNQMHFSSIIWDADEEAETVTSTDVNYIGFYGKTHISDDANHSNLFLAGGNQLYWQTDGEDENAKMLGFRAYFQVVTSGASLLPVSKGMPASLRIRSTPTGVSEAPRYDVQCTKVLQNGQLYLMYEGAIFDVRGNKIKEGGQQ